MCNKNVRPQKFHFIALTHELILHPFKFKSKWGLCHTLQLSRKLQQESSSPNHSFVENTKANSLAGSKIYIFFRTVPSTDFARC